MRGELSATALVKAQHWGPTDTGHFANCSHHRPDFLHQFLPPTIADNN
jgi:hypothetical protein